MRETTVEKAKIGAACGRFQIFHNDHLKYVLAAKKECDYLLVGITSADPSASPKEKADPNRGKSTSNPCTYFERMEMVRDSLLEAGLSREEFDIIPFPIGRPELLAFYIPDETRCLITIYDEWGENKKQRLEDLGYEVGVLWHVTPETKGISASTIRARIASGEAWAEMVPPAVYRYITAHEIDKRIARLISEEAQVR